MKKLPLQIIQHCRSISSRGSRWPVGLQAAYGPTELQKSEMMNGIQIVAARVSGALTTACTVMFQAGSRYETNDNLGATHFIRAMSSGSGVNHTAFAKMRVLQQQGAYLTCTSDRQTLAFTLRCPLPLFSSLKDYLVDAASRCFYHDWEIDDQRRLVRGDLTRMHPEQRVLDLVQNACWAGPLSNSMFCEDCRIDSMSSETLLSFAAANFKSIHCAVATVGISFEEAMQVAEMIDSGVVRPMSEQCHTRPCFRSGIETYDLGPGSDTWIAAAVRGCGTGDVNNLFKHAIIASACGSANMTEGQHALDRTPQGPIGMLSQNDLFSDYKAFNISYMDTGIFGIVVKTKAATACDAAYLATDFLANISSKLSEREIEEGKKRLQLNLALHDEDPVRASQGLALQALSGAHIDTAENAIFMVDAIANAEVAAAANSLGKQMSIAIVGDEGAVPTDMFCNI